MDDEKYYMIGKICTQNQIYEAEKLVEAQIGLNYRESYFQKASQSMSLTTTSSLEAKPLEEAGFTLAEN